MCIIQRFVSDDRDTTSDAAASRSQEIERPMIPKSCSSEDFVSAASTDAGSDTASPLSDTSVVEFEPGCYSCSAEETCIFFDWDDTILPTSWLDRRGLLRGKSLGEPSNEQKPILQALAKSAADMLEVAMGCGTVMIITNGTEGWVERTCERFMPELEHLVKQVPVVSARACYGCHAPNSPDEWKRLAFEAESRCFMDSLPPGCKANFLSLGDSHHEYYAMRNAAQFVPGCLVKCCKFANKPHTTAMLREQSFVATYLHEVIKATDSLDINITVSVEQGALACFPRVSDSEITSYYELQQPTGR